jgi:hypothetical protein
MADFILKGDGERRLELGEDREDAAPTPYSSVGKNGFLQGVKSSYKQVVLRVLLFQLKAIVRPSP